MARKKQTFEEALQKLENLVEEMDRGTLSLQESLAAFEEDIALTRFCQQILDKAETKIRLWQEEEEKQVDLSTKTGRNNSFGESGIS